MPPIRPFPPAIERSTLAVERCGSGAVTANGCTAKPLATIVVKNRVRIMQAYDERHRHYAANTTNAALEPADHAQRRNDLTTTLAAAGRSSSAASSKTGGSRCGKAD
ncbi:hypothetical protein [Candidatus Accumulibacter sp. ACC003]|uniref:hypothetical protein n=1 Tax=Candidatus Accumulibacter sp. ACC003 TaxID=2823334 RepID=UPI0025BB0312|nr:hypothetical protein [Candidatus Accumulibacter sp. ACC003]